MNYLNPPSEDQIESLRGLDQSCGSDTNKHDRAIVLIHACIGEGHNTKERILEVLRLIGWNLKHARIVLSKSTGNNPSLHRWRRDEAGVYHSHP